VLKTVAKKEQSFCFTQRDSPTAFPKVAPFLIGKINEFARAGLKILIDHWDRKWGYVQTAFFQRTKIAYLDAVKVALAPGGFLVD